MAEAKKILLVGHCGPDSSYLRMTLRNADPQAQILAADSDKELQRALDSGVDLVLFNRELGYGFADATGVGQIRLLRKQHPEVKSMLVSNYPDAQADAVAAGALPGFGKRELGTNRVVQLLRQSLQQDAATHASE